MSIITTKTILTAYASLSTIIGHIEALVYEKAVSSHNLGVDAYQQTTGQIDAIFILIQKKTKLIELKSICEQALEMLPLNMQQILSLRYYERLTPVQIINKLSIPNRTYFRFNNNAIEALSKIFDSLGYNESWFTETYLDQQWLSRIYNGCVYEQSKKLQKCG